MVSVHFEILNMAQGSSAVHKTDSSSVNSFYTPAVIADVSYFLHRRRCPLASFVTYAHVRAAYLTSKSSCASRKTGTSFFSDRDPQVPQPENCAGGKLRRLDRFYELCSKKNGKKLFLNSSRCFVTRYSYFLTNLKLRWNSLELCTCPLPGYEGSYFAFESSTANCILAFVQGKDKLKIAFLTLRRTIDESSIFLKGTVEKTADVRGKVAKKKAQKYSNMISREL